MRKWTLPIVLGIVTGLLLIALLWKPQSAQRKVVVAARDLGAGVALTAADLTTLSQPESQAPADAIPDPSQLVGQTLAVVRFAGEPVTPRHLGPAVDLKPDERGVAVKVRADTGLAGLLRPGMKVGVVATLDATAPQGDGAARLQGNAIYAKLALEGLRVVYVSPDFQARPDVPVTLQATVQGGKAASSGGLFGSDAQPVFLSSSDTSAAPRDGVIVLAASMKPQQILYLPPTDEAMSAFGGVPLTASLPPTMTARLSQPASGTAPTLRWVVPAELVAALNAADALTLVLLPPSADEAGTPGLLLGDVLVDTGRAGGGNP